MDVLESEIKRSSRTWTRPFAILLVDMDGLKKINDRFGHLYGEPRSVQAIADILRVYCSAISIQLQRYGGDVSFVLVMPETGAQEAEQVALRV